jgi:general secretion pathway protein E/type IV pilus assembly protein PilB
MIRQTAIKEGFLDFADGIKALLRQDPDIIFIGEIRDHVTAEMALKAAMTGHQVYTTLHTNDSFGAIPRLIDLGMKPGMISGSIVAIFAQRLARRLCKNCKQEHVATEEECKLLRIPEGEPAPTICHAAEGGCNACNGTGYKGRIGIVEILTFDEEMDDILARGADKVELKNAAREKGFKSMREDGILKILQGTTSLEEISGTVDLTKE